MPIQNPLGRSVKKRNGCIEWTGAVSNSGYGLVQFRKHGMTAHRKVWILTFGAIPSGLHVCHSCDNRLCINPKHLWLGTAKDNARDRDKKGRNGGALRRARTTHCVNGHKYTKSNTYWHKKRRWCRVCIRAKSARFNARLKEQ